ELIKQREVSEAEERVRGELVDDVLAGTYGDEGNAIRRARYLRYDLTVPHGLLVADIDEFARSLREHRLEEERVLALKQQVRQLAQVEDRAGVAAFAGRVLDPLAAYDRARGTPLIQTLDVYLQRHGNLRQSARDLHVHLNTLHYRLRRIAEITGMDLKDADARLDLLLALRVRALAGSK